MPDEKKPDLKIVPEKKPRERAPLSMGMGAKVRKREDESLVVNLGGILGVIPAPPGEEKTPDEPGVEGGE